MSRPTLMLLGSGELGKEVTISAQRLGCRVIAVDRYANAPAMQVATESAVIDMLDGEQLEALVQRYKPDYIVPEVEAIRTTQLLALEAQGFRVIPNAKATHTTMNRDVVRDIASKKLKLKTARYAYAESLEELQKQCALVGFPCVIKPIMSSSGKGQSVAKNAKDVANSWQYAQAGARGDAARVIVEEFIYFHLEITLLTVRQKKGPTLFLPPIGHRQEKGDYRESWMPAAITSSQLKKAQKMAKKMTDHLGGVGLFGVEFFVTKNDVYFSELSPRPHDTGMVTLVSQDLNQFDLHVRAILGLPIPDIRYMGPSASAVILSKHADGEVIEYSGLNKALAHKGVDIRIFGKKHHRMDRRMGVTLAKASTAPKAVALAKKAAASVKVK